MLINALSLYSYVPIVYLSEYTYYTCVDKSAIV